MAEIRFSNLIRIFCLSKNFAWPRIVETPSQRPWIGQKKFVEYQNASENPLELVTFDLQDKTYPMRIELMIFAYAAYSSV